MESAFCIPQVPFAFEFESERLNGNLATNSNSVTVSTFPNLTNDNLVTVMLPNFHLVVQTQTQTQTEPDVFQKHTWKFRVT